MIYFSHNNGTNLLLYTYVEVVKCFWFLFFSNRRLTKCSEQFGRRKCWSLSKVGETNVTRSDPPSRNRRFSKWSAQPLVSWFIFLLHLFTKMDPLFWRTSKDMPTLTKLANLTNLTNLTGHSVSSPNSGSCFPSPRKSGL